jgi:hypothetical protein
MCLLEPARIGARYKGRYPVSPAIDI